MHTRNECFPVRTADHHALVALSVPAHVPNELKQDSNDCEQEHSNEQACHRWRDFLAGVEWLREGGKAALVEGNVRQPVAHAGRPRDVAEVAAHLLALA